MKYYVDTQVFDTPEDVAEYCITYEDFEDNYDSFNDYLDDCYPACEIGARKYSPSEILKYCDEDTYDDYMRDWIDGEVDYARDNLISDLNMMVSGETIDIYSYVIHAKDEDEDDDGDDINIGTNIEDLRERILSCKENEDFTDLFNSMNIQVITG